MLPAPAARRMRGGRRPAVWRGNGAWKQIIPQRTDNSRRVLSLLAKTRVLCMPRRKIATSEYPQTPAWCVLTSPGSRCRNHRHFRLHQPGRIMRLTLLATTVLIALLSHRVAADVTLVADRQPRCAILVDPAVMAHTAAKKPLAKARGPVAEAEAQRIRLQESVNDLAVYLQKM